MPQLLRRRDCRRRASFFDPTQMDEWHSQQDYYQYSDNPLQRMKFVITSSISFFYATHTFDKPLNPILGETYQAIMEDGTEICLEQVAHHPPISYLY